MMKAWWIIAIFLCASFGASAQSPPKSCDDVKEEIAKKLDAKGVTGYALTIVDKGKEGDGKVVGNCGQGAKSILYSKNTAAAKPKPSEK
jgi:hypothetical protein